MDNIKSNFILEKKIDGPPCDVVTCIQQKQKLTTHYAKVDFIFTSILG